jgi:HPt (histidine-containing phosphotransfer) domain-containing protein
VGHLELLILDKITAKPNILPHPMATEVTIDPEAIENLRALNPDDDNAFLKEIIGIFLEDTPQRIAELKQSLSAFDQPKFTRAAHSIKGSASNLGATKVRAYAEQIEHQSRNCGLNGLEQLLGSLEKEFALAKAELEKIASA